MLKRFDFTSVRHGSSRVLSDLTNLAGFLIVKNFTAKCLLHVYPAYLYHLQRSWGKVLFSQACVILFTGGLPQCMLGYTNTPRADTPPGADAPEEQTPPSPGTDTPQEQTPPEQTPPGADTPLEQTSPPPPPQSMLGDTVNARAVRILLECKLVTKSANCSVLIVLNKCLELTNDLKFSFCVVICFCNY